MNVTTTATQRALAQWDEYTLEETRTPGLFKVTRNGATYHASATRCNCPHHVNRGVECKHMARVKIRLASRSHWAADEAEARSAQARADREALWS